MIRQGFLVDPDVGIADDWANGLSREKEGKTKRLQLCSTSLMRGSPEEMQKAGYSLVRKMKAATNNNKNRSTEKCNSTHRRHTESSSSFFQLGTRASWKISSSSSWQLLSSHCWWLFYAMNGNFGLDCSGWPIDSLIAKGKKEKNKNDDWETWPIDDNTNTQQSFYFFFFSPSLSVSKQDA